MRRPGKESSAYLLLNDDSFWTPNMWNNTLKISFNHTYKYPRGSGKIDLNLKSSTLGSDYQYAQVNLEVLNDLRINTLRLKTRFYLLHTTGNAIAPESKLFAAGANPEELMNNKFTRSTGFVNRNWMEYGSALNHFQMGGGLNLRGFAGYLMPEGDLESQEYLYSGTSGASFSSELEFSALSFGTSVKSIFYLFADAGILNSTNLNEAIEWSDLRADAGLGMCFSLLNNIDNVKPLKIRLDLPWFINTPPFGENYIDFNRFVIGINRAF